MPENLTYFELRHLGNFVIRNFNDLCSASFHLLWDYIWCKFLVPFVNSGKKIQ